jgi:putative acetyltransferase
MQLLIRPGAEHELQQLCDLQSLSIRAFYQAAYTPEQTETLIKTQNKGICHRKRFLMVAEVAGEIVGFATLSRQVFHIDAVYVHPNWMRRGIGQQLVVALETIAQQQQYPKLIVTAALHTTGFYQAQGFQVVGEYDYPLEQQQPLPCHLLEKSLRSGEATIGTWFSALIWIMLMILGLWGVFSQVAQRRSPQLIVPSHSTLSQ